jgi:ribosomal protein L7/L12
MPDSGGSQRRWWSRPLHVPKSDQQEADRRAGQSLISLLDPAGKAEVETLLARGEFVPAVRRVRELTGLRLIDAKRAVDSLRRP